MDKIIVHCKEGNQYEKLIEMLPCHTERIRDNCVRIENGVIVNHGNIDIYKNDIYKDYTFLSYKKFIKLYGEEMETKKIEEEIKALEEEIKALEEGNKALEEEIKACEKKLKALQEELDKKYFDLSKLPKFPFTETDAQKAGFGDEGFFQVRGYGENKNKAFYLANTCDWELTRDSNKALCLIPTRKD
jgi:seryl-tRNA synthetase